VLWGVLAASYGLLGERSSARKPVTV